MKCTCEKCREKRKHNKGKGKEREGAVSPYLSPSEEISLSLSLGSSYGCPLSDAKTRRLLSLHAEWASFGLLHFERTQNPSLLR